MRRRINRLFDLSIGTIWFGSVGIDGEGKEYFRGLDVTAMPDSFKPEAFYNKYGNHEPFILEVCGNDNSVQIIVSTNEDERDELVALSLETGEARMLHAALGCYLKMLDESKKSSEDET